MSEKPKTDLALFGAAFFAIVLVPGANTTDVTSLGAIISAH